MIIIKMLFVEEETYLAVDSAFITTYEVTRAIIVVVYLQYANFVNLALYFECSSLFFKKKKLYNNNNNNKNNNNNFFLMYFRED